MLHRCHPKSTLAEISSSGVHLKASELLSESGANDSRMKHELVPVLVGGVRFTQLKLQSENEIARTKSNLLEEIRHANGSIIAELKPNYDGAVTGYQHS
ncbi:hypothetical protein VNO78_02396 [Psophocarpus tetragonolobus]|uniref:Uncharacterized protein n=1 Tax=Psophocarpus tetragonolobus TaxID=3891 RepID=A0AAN9XUQ6_PSOTE